MRRGRRAEAVETLKGITRARPDNAEAHAELARVLLEWKMTDEALSALRRATTLAPDDPARRRELAAAAAASDRFDEAVRAWEKVLELAHDDAARDEAWTQVVNLYQERERLPELRQRCEARYGANPDDAQAVRRLGAVLERLDPVDAPSRALGTGSAGARRLYERYLERHRDTVWAMTRLAQTCALDDDKDRAVALYERLVELDRANARRYLRELTGIRLDQGKLVEAVRTAERLVAIYPQDAAAHAELARVYESLERYDEAAKSLEQALRLRPDDAEIHFSLGAARMVQGRLGEAARQFQEVLRLDPGHDGVRKALAMHPGLREKLILPPGVDTGNSLR